MATDQALADQLIDTIRDWVNRDVIPHVDEFEQSDEFPQPWSTKCARLVCLAPPLPKNKGAWV